MKELVIQSNGMVFRENVSTVMAEQIQNVLLEHEGGFHVTLESGVKLFIGSEYRKNSIIIIKESE